MTIECSSSISCLTMGGRGFVMKDGDRVGEWSLAVNTSAIGELDGGGGGTDRRRWNSEGTGGTGGAKACLSDEGGGLELASVF